MYRIIGADQQEYGPVTADELRKWMAEGRANGQTLVRAEGGEWRPLSSFPEFGAGVASTPPPLTLPPQVAAPSGLPPLSSIASSTPRTHAFAVTGLIMGILSVTCGMCCCHGLPFNLLGIVFSVVALAQISSHPGHYGGRGLAIAGLVLSLISILLVALLMVVGVAFSWQDLIREFK
jgi:hypothetical protein